MSIAPYFSAARSSKAIKLAYASLMNSGTIAAIIFFLQVFFAYLFSTPCFSAAIKILLRVFSGISSLPLNAFDSVDTEYPVIFFRSLSVIICSAVRKNFVNAFSNPYCNLLFC